jgi:hypothetical protein
VTFSPIACINGTAPHEIGTLNKDSANLTHRRLEDPHLEQHHRLGGLLHLVDGVIHRSDQVLDVTAIERGNESPPDRGENFPSDLVGVVFELVDPLAVNRGFVPAAHHSFQRLGSLHHCLGVPGEQVKNRSSRGSSLRNQPSMIVLRHDRICHLSVINRFAGQQAEIGACAGHPPFYKSKKDRKI